MLRVARFHCHYRDPDDSPAAGFFGVVFGNRFGVQSPDAEAVLLLSSVLCILSLPLFISLTSGL